MDLGVPGSIPGGGTNNIRHLRVLARRISTLARAIHFHFYRRAACLDEGSTLDRRTQPLTLRSFHVQACRLGSLTAPCPLFGKFRVAELRHASMPARIQRNMLARASKPPCLHQGVSQRRLGTHRAHRQIGGEATKARRRFVNRFKDLTSRLRSNEIPKVLLEMFTARPSKETVDLCYAWRTWLPQHLRESRAREWRASLDT